MSSAPLIVLPISSISHVIPGFPCNHITVFVLVLYLPIQIVVGSYRAIVIWRCPDHGLSNTAFLADSEPSGSTWFATFVSLKFPDSARPVTFPLKGTS